jgi:hydrogenase/urease accessory protein HupE
MPRHAPLADRKHRLARSASWLLAGGLACVLFGATPGAHEIGTTRVVARFNRDKTYTIEVTTDAGALLGRLELARKRPRSSPASAAEYQQAFGAVCGELPRHVAVVFDGVPSMPRADCVVDAPDSVASEDLSALGVTVTLQGVVPADAQTFRWRYDLTFASYALTMKAPEPQAAETMWLEGGEESRPVALSGVAAPPSRAAVARTYLGLGFRHIVPDGLDHILFVLGIFLLSRHLRPILWQVSAFTLAHSMTLGLTLYGVIAVPSSIVEPMIALSIVYVAVENLITSELKPWRVALVFGFGLLHGMGFAGVLREMALPPSEILTGLVAFNAGVEAGQLTVILSASLVVGAWARRSDRYRRLIVVPGSAAIALTGLVWTMQRLAM